eukprot:TRINITY_DN13250_c0_g1_i2.p1 TRINITY_DN13250_c0_g1~~TRINITY_DN13250_c0_g1_i2.p1  ORF type:complete len:405 (-),score=45.77 TRINITY_DN13250_c0_g1_i2:145-1359(-)
MASSDAFVFTSFSNLPSKSRRRRDRLKRTAILKSKHHSELLSTSLYRASSCAVQSSSTLNLDAPVYIPQSCVIAQQVNIVLNELTCCVPSRRQLRDCLHADALLTPSTPVSEACDGRETECARKSTSVLPDSVGAVDAEPASSEEHTKVSVAPGQWVDAEPKRPPSAYFLFVQKRRSELSGPPVDVSKQLNTEWSNMCPDDRLVYESSSARLKLEFERKSSEFARYGRYREVSLDTSPEDGTPAVSREESFQRGHEDAVPGSSDGHAVASAHWEIIEEPLSMVLKTMRGNFPGIYRALLEAEGQQSGDRPPALLPAKVRAEKIEELVAYTCSALHQSVSSDVARQVVHSNSGKIQTVVRDGVEKMFSFAEGVSNATQSSNTQFVFGFRLQSISKRGMPQPKRKR